MNEHPLYEQVTLIVQDYLGPAAERFVVRQITFHLGKSPEELTPDDIPKLIEWTKITLGLLTEDRHLISEYETKMTQLLDYA